MLLMVSLTSCPFFDRCHHMSNLKKTLPNAQCYLVKEKYRHQRERVHFLTENVIITF